jgi:hypothetical protein
MGCDYNCGFWHAISMARGKVEATKSSMVEALKAMAKESYQKEIVLYRVIGDFDQGLHR